MKAYEPESDLNIQSRYFNHTSGAFEFLFDCDRNFEEIAYVEFLWNPSSHKND